MKTIPATEEDLMIDKDAHPFDEDLPKTANFEEQMHPVLVDGIKGKACTGTVRIPVNAKGFPWNYN